MEDRAGRERVRVVGDAMAPREPDEIARLGRDDVLDSLGIEISPARLKCALLSLQTLRQALAERVAWQAVTDDAAP